MLGWLCYAHATSYNFKEVVGCRTCDEKAYDAAICILPFGMMSLYERHDLHGYFALRLFFVFLLLPFLRFFGTGFVHQYHLQYFLFGLNASLNSQYRVPAPLLLWRHLSQSHGILLAFLMCSIAFIDVPYFPFDMLKSSFFFKNIKKNVRKLFAENFLYKENLFVFLSEQ